MPLLVFPHGLYLTLPPPCGASWLSRSGATPGAPNAHAPSPALQAATPSTAFSPSTAATAPSVASFGQRTGSAPTREATPGVPPLPAATSRPGSASSLATNCRSIGYSSASASSRTGSWVPAASRRLRVPAAQRLAHAPPHALPSPDVQGLRTPPSPDERRGPRPAGQGRGAAASPAEEDYLQRLEVLEVLEKELLQEFAEGDPAAQRKRRGLLAVIEDLRGSP